MQLAMQNVVEGRTRRNARAGFALMEEAPWNRYGSFAAGVRGYAAAQGANTNWRQLHREVSGLLAERWRNSSMVDLEGKIQRGEESAINLSIAQEWARRDLGAAITWYVDELPAEGARLDARTLVLLQAVEADDRYRVVEWFEDQANRGAGALDGALVAKYASGLASRKPEESLLERLLQIRQAEQHRGQIIGEFVGPTKRDGDIYLRNPPELLRRLIEVARLSEGERGRWLEVVENTPYKGS